jgi:hypothetical protein
MAHYCSYFVRNSPLLTLGSGWTTFRLSVGVSVIRMGQGRLGRVRIGGTVVFSSGLGRGMTQVR